MFTEEAEEMVSSFDSVENMQEYVRILAETIQNVTTELGAARVHALQIGESKRANAVELAAFKTLQCYLYKIRRPLNDLQILRSLVVKEGPAPKTMTAAN